MANKVKNFSDRPPEERVEIARMGGIASGESRRRSAPLALGDWTGHHHPPLGQTWSQRFSIKLNPTRTTTLPAVWNITYCTIKMPKE